MVYTLHRHVFMMRRSHHHTQATHTVLGQVTFMRIKFHGRENWKPYIHWQGSIGNKLESH